MISWDRVRQQFDWRLVDASAGDGRNNVVSSAYTRSVKTYLQTIISVIIVFTFTIIFIFVIVIIFMVVVVSDGDDTPIIRDGTMQLFWSPVYVSQENTNVEFYQYTVSQKNFTAFIFVIFLSISSDSANFGRNILQEIWNKHKCTGNHISFHMFVLYHVKPRNDFYGIQ